MTKYSLVHWSFSLKKVNCKVLTNKAQPPMRGKSDFCGSGVWLVEVHLNRLK